MIKTITTTSIAFIASAILILNASCKKNNDFDYQSFYACNDAQNATASQVKTNIVGDWTLVTVGGGMGADQPATEKVSVRIESTGTYILKENDAIISQANWDIAPHNLGGFGMTSTSTSFVPYINGEITLCGKQLQFSTGKVDGPSYFFVRTN